MKRKTAALALILALITLLCSCGQKIAVNAADFKADLEALDFTVMDVTQLYSTKDTCEVVYKATSPDNKYSFNFYQYTNAASAKNEYLYLTTSYRDGDESSGNNFDKLVFSNAGTYVTVVRVDNTLLHASIPTLYYKAAIEVISRFGY